MKTLHTVFKNHSTPENKTFNSKGGTLRSMPLLLTAVSLLTVNNCGFAVTFERGAINGALDSTFSFGAQWRLDDPDSTLISQANGGTQGLSVTKTTGASGDGSSNTDNGNLNYQSGLVASTLKGTHELSLSYDNYGLFVRGTYYFDPQNHDAYKDRTANTTDIASNTRLSSLYTALGALNSAGFLDTSRFPAGNLSAGTTYELSEQAESAIARDAQLLDAFISAAWNIGDRPLDVRLGRQVISWGESTFIQNSINDINPVDVPALRLPGAELREGLLPVSMLWSSLGLTQTLTLEAFYQLDWQQTRVDEPGTYFSSNDFVGDGGRFVTISGLDECTDNALACTYPNTVTRAGDRTPGDTGQYGVALRWYAENFNNTEFGFYAMNYHSRRPIISAIAGSYNATTFTTTFLGSLNFLTTTAGVPLAQAGAPSLIAAQNNSLVSGTGQYYLEYPEDIKLFGLSFNTSLDTTGVALSGEISIRPDAPIQLDDQELLQAALSSSDTLVTNALTSIGFGSAAPAFTQSGNSQYNSVFGNPAQGGQIKGYIEKEVIQTQVTASKVFGPQLGASQWILIGEVGATHINLPLKSVLLTDAPGTPDDGQSTNQQGFGDDFSWGYRIRARFDYNNFFSNWNMKTTYSLAHDVNGNTPLPIANFLEDRKAFEIGLDFDRQSTYGVGLRYATFWGAGERNLIQDRDFAALTFSVAL